MIRASYYLYEFGDDGLWKRTYIDAYLPPVTLEALRPLPSSA